MSLVCLIILVNFSWYLIVYYSQQQQEGILVKVLKIKRFLYFITIITICQLIDFIRIF
jgi:hypothetical protein